MTPEAWQQVKAAFETALDLPSTQRSAFLDDCVGCDNETRDAVDRLLRAEPESTGYLEPPTPETFEAAGAASIPTSCTVVVGSRIGAYEIVRPLGSGGMGTVYEAVQASPHRTVALKMMRSGLVSATAVRRFRHEAELLARLHHPGIAQIYEAGVRDEGGVETPWFAMELLEDAAPILDFAERRDLDLERRTDLFLDVCAAVHHGHQRGVIHRDLKPANILVDAEGRAKVIDFGIGRATVAAEEASLQLTKDGDLMGTLQYMSPEQLAGHSDDPNIRTDVYSLGVVLYELLTGASPYDLSGKSLTEKGRIISEQDPPRPSTRFDGLAAELDWITIKAMAKEPERRYASVQELAEDLRRFRAHQPVHAGPPTRGYYLRKFVRRHQMVVAAAAIVLSTLVVGATVSVLFAFEANAQRRVAEVKRDDARRASYAAGLQNATFRLRERPDIQEALELLRRAPEECRGWEWWHLWSRILHGEPAAQVNLDVVTGFDWMAAARVATFVGFAGQDRADQKRAVVVLGPEPGAQRRLDLANATCVSLSEDARVLYAGVTSGAVVRFDLETERREELRPPGSQITQIARAGPGRLVVATSEGCVELWDLDTASLVAQEKLHRGWINAISVDPTRTLIATGGADGLIFVLDARDLSRVRRERVSGGIVGVNDVALTLDGDLIAVWGTQGKASLWHKARPQLDFESGCGRCAVGPDGSIAVVWKDRMVGVFRHEAQRVAMVRKLTSASAAGLRLAWLSEHEVVTVSNLGEIYRYDLAESPAWQQQRSGTRKAVTAVAVAADGDRVWAGDYAGDVVRNKLASDDQQPLRDAGAAAHRARVTAVRVSPDGARILSASLDGTLAVWDAEQSSLIERVEVGEPITDAAFLPDGRRVVIGTTRGAIATVALGTAEVTDRIGDAHHDYVTCVRVAPDGRSIVSASEAGDVACHTADGRLQWRADEAHQGWVSAVAFTPDGRQLATAGADRAVRLWDAVTGEFRRSLWGHRRCPSALAFVDGGARLLSSGGFDWEIRVWLTETGEHVLSLLARSTVFDLVASADYVVAGTMNGTVEAWRAFRTPLDTLGESPARQRRSVDVRSFRPSYRLPSERGR